MVFNIRIVIKLFRKNHSSVTQLSRYILQNFFHFVSDTEEALYFHGVCYPEHVLTWEGYGNRRVSYPEHV